MTQEEKQLLLKDLCARLPYGVIAYASEINKKGIITDVNIPYNMVNLTDDNADGNYELVPLFDIKPYLRPMSSMTEEERDEIEEMSFGWFYVDEKGYIYPIGRHTHGGEFEDAILPTLEWLNKKMFDYRYLIPMGLALQMPEDMYKTE